MLWNKETVHLKTLSSIEKPLSFHKDPSCLGSFLSSKVGTAGDSSVWFPMTSRLEQERRGVCVCVCQSPEWSVYKGGSRSVSAQLYLTTGGQMNVTYSGKSLMKGL